MDLSKIERYMIANQLKILEKLYPDEANYYSQHRKAIEEGYALHYSWIFEHIMDGLTIDECKEVLDILDMFRALRDAYERLEDKNIIDFNKIKFIGFDGNYETKYLMYATYFIVDLNRYDELKVKGKYPDFNSHVPMIDKYRSMLSKWKDSRNKYELSKDDLIRIIEN